MKLPLFKTEQWMTDYENLAIYNLTDTCYAPFTLNELLSYSDLPDFPLNYGDITGNPILKQEILNLYQTGIINNITLTPGCSEANYLVMTALLSKGDHVITFTPNYEQFSRIPESLGCTVTEIPLQESNRWQPSIQDILSSIQPNTKMFIFNNPNNPTGIPFTKEVLDTIISIATKLDIYVLVDEIYREETMPSISDLYAKGISTSSLSKVFALPGLRLGWIKAPEEIIDLINYHRDYHFISTGPLLDNLAFIALRHRQKIYQRNQAIFEANKKVILNWLSSETRCSLHISESTPVSFLAYNLPILSEPLAKNLLKDTGVFFVPGSCFGKEYHLRLGLTNIDTTKTEQGLQKLSDYLDQFGFFSDCGDPNLVTPNRVDQ